MKGEPEVACVTTTSVHQHADRGRRELMGLCSTGELWCRLGSEVKGAVPGFAACKCGGSSCVLRERGKRGGL